MEIANLSTKKVIAEFINCVGNALNLQDFVVLKSARIYLNLWIRRGRAFASMFINCHRNLYMQMLYPLRYYRSLIAAVWELLLICEGLGREWAKGE
jgi:hypothetical protein